MYQWVKDVNISDASPMTRSITRRSTAGSSGVAALRYYIFLPEVIYYRGLIIHVPKKIILIQQ